MQLSAMPHIYPLATSCPWLFRMCSSSSNYKLTLRHASAEERVGDMSLNLGLARFSALSRLDLLAPQLAHASKCPRDPDTEIGPVREYPVLPLFVLTEASLGHLTHLAPSLTSLRLHFHECAEVQPLLCHPARAHIRHAAM